MKTEELKQIALAAAKNIKTEQDLAEFQQMLTKVTVEAALNAELVDHLGYERHEKSDGSNPPCVRIVVASFLSSCNSTGGGMRESNAVIQ